MLRARDQRRYSRFPVQGIYGSLRTPRDVRVLNLSRSGVSFETTEKVSEGENCFLELRFHAEVASLEVKILWVMTREGDGSGGSASEVPVYQAGGTFIDIHRDRADGFWSALEVSASSGVAEAP